MANGRIAYVLRYANSVSKMSRFAFTLPYVVALLLAGCCEAFSPHRLPKSTQTVFRGGKMIHQIIRNQSSTRVFLPLFFRFQLLSSVREMRGDVFNFSGGSPWRKKQQQEARFCGTRSTIHVEALGQCAKYRSLVVMMTRPDASCPPGVAENQRRGNCCLFSPFEHLISTVDMTRPIV